jgi:aminotransferase
LLELREAVAAKLQRDNGIIVTPDDEVAITNGVSQAIHIVFDSFVNAGDKIVLADPSFLVYALAAQYHRARVAWVRSWLEDGRTKLDGRQLQRAMRGAKLVIVNSPSNPTGGVMGLDTLENILYLARRYDVLVLSDEVYERFVYDGRHTSIASLAGARERLITANSFSKSHAMPGCRIGYMAAIRHLMRPMMVHQFVATPFAPVASQRLAIRALSEPRGRSQQVVRQYDARRRTVHRALGETGLACDLPGGAFYLWASIEQFGLSGLEFSSRLLERHKVLLMPGDHFGPSGPNHVRISYAAPQAKLDEGLRRLGRFVAELRGGDSHATAGRELRHDPAHCVAGPHAPSPAGTPSAGLHAH